MPLTDEERQALQTLIGETTAPSSDDGGFDFSTAQPADDGFDLASAAPIETTTPHIPSRNPFLDALGPVGIAMQGPPGTTWGDVARSGAEYLGNTTQAVMHPIQTVKGLGNIAAGVAQKVIPGQQSQEPYADAIGQFIQQRYGNFDKFRETWKRDPVGVAADASMLLGGASSVAKISSIAGIPKAVRFGAAAAKAAELLDPLTITTQATKAAARAGTRGMGKAASHAMNSLIKPSNRQFAFGKNPGEAVAKEGIVAGSLDELALKVGQRRQQLGQQIGVVLDAPEIAKQSINATDALEPITTALQQAKKNPRTNATVIQRLENLRDDLLGVTIKEDGSTVVTRDLTALQPRQALELKQTIGELTKWTENASDDNIVNGALKQAYGSVRAKIERVAPGIKATNERYANLLEAERAAKNQAYVMQRRPQFGMYDVIAGSAGGATGGVGGAAMGVILAQGAKAAMNSPYVRSQMASWMTRATPTEINAFFKRIPGLESEAMRVGLLAGTGQQRLNDAVPPSDYRQRP